MTTDRDADTIPPGPFDAAEEIADLKASLIHANELALETQAALLESRRLTVRLINRLTIVGIAQLASEAKGIAHDLELKDHARRLLALENPATAAE